MAVLDVRAYVCMQTIAMQSEAGEIKMGVGADAKFKIEWRQESRAYQADRQS